MPRTYLCYCWEFVPGPSLATLFTHNQPSPFPTPPPLSSPPKICCSLNLPTLPLHTGLKPSNRTWLEKNTTVLTCLTLNLWCRISRGPTGLPASPATFSRGIHWPVFHDDYFTLSNHQHFFFFFLLSFSFDWENKRKTKATLTCSHQQIYPSAYTCAHCSGGCVGAGPCAGSHPFPVLARKATLHSGHHGRGLVQSALGVNSSWGTVTCPESHSHGTFVWLKSTYATTLPHLVSRHSSSSSLPSLLSRQYPPLCQILPSKLQANSSISYFKLPWTLHLSLAIPFCPWSFFQKIFMRFFFFSFLF